MLSVFDDCNVYLIFLQSTVGTTVFSGLRTEDIDIGKILITFIYGSLLI